MVDSLHEWIIDSDDKDLASILELGVVNVPRNMGARASRAYMSELDNLQSLSSSKRPEVEMIHTVSGGDTDDDTFTLELLGKVDLVSWRVLNQDVEVWDRISLLDECRCSLVEQGPLAESAGSARSKAAGSEHD